MTLRAYTVKLSRSGRDSMAKFISALVVLKGYFTDSRILDGPTMAPPVVFRILLPEGTEGRFRELTGLQLAPEVGKTMPDAEAQKIVFTPDSMAKIAPLSQDKLLALPPGFTGPAAPTPESYLVEDLLSFFTAQGLPLNEAHNRARRVARDFLESKGTLWLDSVDLLSVIVHCVVAMKAIGQEQELIESELRGDPHVCPDCDPFSDMDFGEFSLDDEEETGELS